MVGSKQISSRNNNSNYYYVRARRDLRDLPLLPLQVPYEQTEAQRDDCPGHSLKDVGLSLQGIVLQGEAGAEVAAFVFC